MILTAVELLVVVAAALLFSCFAWYRPGLTIIGTLSAAAFFECLQVGTSSVDVGVNFYLADAAGAVLCATVLLLILRFPGAFHRDAIWCLILLLVVAVNVARGTAEYGLKPAGNNARNLFTFTAPALAVMCLHPINRLGPRELARWFVYAASLLCSIALLRWTGLIATPVVLRDGLREIVRVLPADYAMIIAQGLIAAIYLQLSTPKTVAWGSLATLLGVVTVALQHRSVWAALLVGGAWFLLRTVRLSTMRWAAFAVVGAVAVIALITCAPALTNSTTSLFSTNILETASYHNTWSWRVQGFAEATDRFFTGTLPELLVGPPSGWYTAVTGSAASIHIHSRYVDTLANYGILGTSVLLAWLWMIGKSLCRRQQSRFLSSPTDPLSAAFLQALFISQLIYLLPYFGGLLQGAVFGAVWTVTLKNSAVRPGALSYQPAWRNIHGLQRGI